MNHIKSALGLVASMTYLFVSLFVFSFAPAGIMIGIVKLFQFIGRCFA